MSDETRDGYGFTPTEYATRYDAIRHDQDPKPIVLTAPGSPDFTVRNLSVLSYASGVTEWSYRDLRMPIDTILMNGFFNSAATMIAYGDVIVISAQDGGAMRYCRIVDGAVILDVLR